MNVLLLGSGGREHALAWKLAQSALLDTLYAAPGNPGIAAHATCVALDATDHAAVVDFVRDHDVGLVVIGPEAPLVDGLGDTLRAGGVPVFGPDRAAAQLEGSKGFTKDLCRRAEIPTAGYVRVNNRTEAEAALAGTFSYPVVIKADGLAAGKGVVIATSEAEAAAAFDTMFGGGDAPVVLEEFLDGEEASLFVLTDGVSLMPFGSAQDHKRVGEGDTGPNTGGMGAYSPAPVLTPALERQAIERIVAPTVKAMADEGMPFSGVLYAGLMLTAAGPKLIEYNARFGDPECQVLMLRYQGDLVEMLLAVAQGRLAALPAAQFSDDVAMTVVLAAAGYPGTPAAGGTIRGIDAAEAGGAVVFQAGTRRDGETLVASGGRVLAVTATGADIAVARDAAYRGIDAVDFPDGFCRRDIGWRELAR
ncbi:phosphoribosylamine--glycine ligase [Sphingomonas insulae]|uniref:Phosphoribosylamine--glycine ligase n=1 Tax=Sphingomonas insulae TaxID=424800 RepID=A0ABN1HLQ3_9SPHN|nr:phosphoribosylamine--glycine ligase [Sphingomonas insulae]NIJ30251.1 phosphoribosylamine--glycine ligase [Sphingomonas insulae]